MKQLLEDAERIKSLEIQGATNVALSAIRYLDEYAKRLNCSNLENCFEKLIEAKEILIETRPTEPAMQNGLAYIMNQLNKCRDTICADDISDKIE